MDTQNRPFILEIIVFVSGAVVMILEIAGSGSTVGNLYAISTAESIAGTFLAGFVLISYLGTRRILFVLALTLLAASFLAFRKDFGTTKVFALLFILFSLFGVTLQESLARERGLVDVDTNYSRVRVIDMEEWADHPHATMVFGGANCAVEMGVQLHRSFPWVDHVCLGEGDGVVAELVLQLLGKSPARPLPGFVGPSERESLLPAALAPPVLDLDALPLPDFGDDFNQLGASPVRASVNPRAELETSRGCWWGAKHHCTFCGLNGLTMRFRSKTQTRALSEIRSVVTRHADDLGPMPRIGFTDNILDLSYFHEFLPALKESRLNLALFYETKANLTRPQVQLQAEAGVSRIQPGIESLSTPLLKLMKKGCTALQNVQLLKWCREFGIHTSWNILYGFPGEDPKEFEHQNRMVARILHLQPPLGVGPVRLERFSPYFVQAQEYGLKNVRPAGPLRYIYSLPEEDLCRLTCHFDFEFPDDRNPQEYVAELSETVARWRKDAKAEFFYSLEWNDRVLLWEGRRKRALSRVLDGETKALYEFCDSVRAFQSIAAHMRSAFGLPEDATRRLLDDFVGSDLMLFDDGHYLSLAVRLHGRAVSGDGSVPSQAERDEAGRDLRLQSFRKSASVRTVSAAVPGGADEVRADTRATMGDFLRNGLIETC